MDNQETPKWTRDTCWRQGCVLGKEATDAFDLKCTPSPESTLAVVISHDCDLAVENLSAEPEVEIIVGRLVEKLEGNFAWGKSPRTLHVEFDAPTPVFVELIATEKRLLKKNALAAFSPDNKFNMNQKSLSILRSWLASRYHRSSFPDLFVNTMTDKKLDEKLSKILKKHGKHITTAFFDLDRGENNDHADGSPYELHIILAYHPGEDADETIAEIESAETEVADLFDRVLHDKKHNKWQGIELKSCFLISEEDLSISQARHFRQWRMEYMSLRSDENHPTPITSQG